MSKSPSFQFYAQDFLTGVMYLTNEEKGVYITMLAKQWTDGKIPKKRLRFLVGFDWENFSEELKEKFKDYGEYIVNERLELEREKKENFIKKQQENGKKGGRPPKKSKKENPNKTQTQTQKKPLEDEDEEEIVKEDEDEEGGMGEETFECEVWPSFGDFWDEYDKKIGKKEKIKKKWDKLKQATKEEVMEYLPKYKQSQPKKKYRKNPETFLNNESWKDEIIENIPSNEKSKTGQSRVQYSDNFLEKIANKVRS